MDRRSLSAALCVIFLIATFASAQDNRAPRSDDDPNDSSSRQTKVDMSPPPGEAPLDLNVKTDRQEAKPWGPHKADHNVEVGDQYYRRRNFQAAVSRYREALYWKENDAIASFRLARALEALGQFAEAGKFYRQYLKILPRGEFAAESQKSIERLKDKPDEPKKPAMSPSPAPRW